MNVEHEKQSDSEEKNDRHEKQTPSPWGPVIELGPFKGPLLVLALILCGAVIGAVGAYFISIRSDIIGPLVKIAVKETIEAQSLATPVPTYTPPEVRQTKVFAIKTFHGRYVTAMNDQPGWDWELKADAEIVNDWEKFDLLYLENGKVALKTHHNRYVTATVDAGSCNILRAAVRERGESEEFILEHAGGGKVAFMTAQGYYVTAGDAGRCWLLRAGTEVRSDWEEFELVAQE